MTSGDDLRCPYHPEAEVVNETYTDALPSHMEATWQDHRCAECDYLIRRTRE